MTFDISASIYELVKHAQTLHASERDLVVESVLIIGKLHRMNAAVNLGMTNEAFIQSIGLTPNIYWKRVQASRVVMRFPEALEMLKSGETEVTHLALVAPKITDANSRVIFSELPRKSRRDVELLLSQVGPKGERDESRGLIDVSLRLTKDQLELLDRAREVLSTNGKVPCLAEVLTKAVEDLLEKRDPVKKAERAAIRKEKAHREDDESSTNKSTSLGKCSEQNHKDHRPGIPASVRYEIWHRDQGKCTWQSSTGERCRQKAMLEVDHKKMVCRGGGNEVENLQLRCRFHNQSTARQQLGASWMRDYKPWTTQLI